MGSRRRRQAIAALGVALIFAAGAYLAVRGSAGLPLGEYLALFLGRPGVELTSGYFTLLDEAGSPILTTGFRVGRGDLFVDEQGLGHRVTKVAGRVAQTMSEPAAASAPAARVLEAIPLGAAQNVIAIYHTHSDESYAPTDGTTSIPGKGGVYDVGETMAAALRSKGYHVIHDYTSHDPHDGGAYPRSRRTALRNLASRPTLLFDLHRDSGRPSDYAGNAGGLDIQRILIVVGGANPNRASNYGLAAKLKAHADSIHPGLVRGILVARGNYNQDLDPGNILLEMGTAVLPKDGAQQAAVLWADVVAAYLGAPGP